MLARRNFLRGLVAAPAVIVVDRLMPVRLWKPEPLQLCFRWRLMTPDGEDRIFTVYSYFAEERTRQLQLQGNVIWQELPSAIAPPVATTGA